MSTGTIALAGCPNCGKSALFNALTGARQHVGNYPGVTVEKKMGTLPLPSGQQLSIIDLPGAYSLYPHSPDEQIAIDILLNRQADTEAPSTVVAITDATNLQRTLGIALELKNLGLLSAIAINMMDLAEKRGQRLDLEQMSHIFGVPVMPIVATKRLGIEALIETIAEQAAQPKPTATQSTLTDWTPPRPTDLLERHRRVSEILKQCILEPTRADFWTMRLDRIFLHRFLGLPLLAVILFTIFQAVFSWAATPMELIEEGLFQLGELIRNFIPYQLLSSLLVDGIIAGVGSVLVFLPQILILFFFIFLLEGSGYMMRAAFLMDHMMHKVGLQGRSFVPLLSSFACAIPGIMATRTIRSPRDRLLTMLLAPFMTCSARLPVYVLLIGAFIPNHTVIGAIKVQGLVMFGLFLLGILSAMLVAYVSKMLLPAQQHTPVIFDLPSYKWPSWRHLGWQLWHRARVFIRKAGRVIMAVSVGIWLLATFPKAPSDWEGSAITYSAAGRLGLAVEPILRPLGFDWRIATGLIPGFAAREVMVGALGTVFAVEGAEDSQHGMKSLQAKISSTWSIATGLSLLIWYVFAPQCLATFVVMRRESNSWKFSGLAFGLMLGLAYLASWLTFRLFSWMPL